MNIRSTFFIPVLAAIIAFMVGCSPNKSADPLPLPSGTFSGQFRLLHRSKGATKIDTSKCQIMLLLDPSTGYRVLGDTATLHAGSLGTYGLTANLIAFQDQTYPKTGTAAKIHLSGYYNYYYDGGSVLQMVFNAADTVSLQYDLKKVN